MGCGPSKETLINNINSQIAKLTEDKVKLETEKKELEMVRQQEKGRSDKLEAEKKLLKSRIDIFEADIKLLEAEIKKESAPVEDPREIELRKTLKEKENELSILKKENEELSKRKNNLETDEQRLKNEQSDLISKINMLNDSISQLTHNITHLLKAEESFSELSVNYKGLSEDYDNKKAFPMNSMGKDLSLFNFDLNFSSDIEK